MFKKMLFSFSLLIINPLILIANNESEAKFAFFASDKQGLDCPVFAIDDNTKPIIEFNYNYPNAIVDFNDETAFSITITTYKDQPEYEGFLWAANDSACKISNLKEKHELYEHIFLKEKLSSEYINAFFALKKLYADYPEEIESDFAEDDPVYGKKITYQSLIPFSKILNFIKPISGLDLINKYIEDNKLILPKESLIGVIAGNDTSDNETERFGRIAYLLCRDQHLESIKKNFDNHEEYINYDKNQEPFVIMQCVIPPNFALEKISTINTHIKKRYGIVIPDQTENDSELLQIKTAASIPDYEEIQNNVKK